MEIQYISRISSTIVTMHCPAKLNNRYVIITQAIIRDEMYISYLIT